MSLSWPADWGPALVAATCAVLVAVAGGVATRTDAWYRRLRVPAWKPPDWAFGPVWACIFVLTATSGVVAWASDPADRLALVLAFGVNGVLNIAWSVLFFRFRRPDWALADVVLLWVSVLAVMLVAGRSGPVAALLNLPYLTWVSIAACLNLRIVQLNPRASFA